MSIRKIKNAKDLSTNELIYFKSHAQATFMNNGLNVEEAITNLENSQNSAKEEFFENIAEKQDIISDLDIIRQGAAKGATALQPSSLATVATSGNYNDLTNKPTIPNAVTESTVSGWGFTKNTGTYSKPSGGIPKSDLASAVQTSLGKADTALQSYTEQYKGTVTGVKINGTIKNPSSGVVDLGTVITAHQDISGKQDKLVSGTNIKTINGESIVGSGDLTIEGGAKIYTWSPTITSIEDTQISGTFTEEEYYNILNADVLYINADGESIFCIARGINSENGEGIRITGSQITTYADFAIDIFVIKEDGVFTGTMSEPIPSKTSQLENDSNFISSDGLKTINGESIIGSGDITISGGSSDSNVKAVTYNFDDWMSENTKRSGRDAIDLTTGEKIYFTGHADLIQYDGGTLIDYIDSKAAAVKIIKLDVEAGSVDYIPEETYNWIFTQEGVLILNGGVAVMVPNEDLNLRHIQSSVVKDDSIVVTKVFLTALGYDSDIVTIDSYPISGGSSNGNGAYSEVNHGTSDTTFTLTPNTFHIWDEVASLTLDFGSETAGIANEYLFQFNSGATATSLTLPDNIKWANDNVPTIAENMIYQVSILKGLASVLEFDNTPQVTTISFKIRNYECIAEEGMTWEEWVDSEYNVIKCSLMGNNVQRYGEIVGTSDTAYVTKTDVIINDFVYELTPMT